MSFFPEKQGKGGKKKQKKSQIPPRIVTTTYRRGGAVRSSNLASNGALETDRDEIRTAGKGRFQRTIGGRSCGR